MMIPLTECLPEGDRKTTRRLTVMAKPIEQNEYCLLVFLRMNRSSKQKIARFVAISIPATSTYAGFTPMTHCVGRWSRSSHIKPALVDRSHEHCAHVVASLCRND
ncbi:hypothetical protein Ae201684P_011253 [Aphanomyces euteiches]|nr:hypothetical protein Ae201684P_011253 [Aphanomyces euteiches]